MRQYIIRRLLLFMPTLLLVSILIFLLIRVVPGDAALAMLGEGDFTDDDLRRAGWNVSPVLTILHPSMLSE